MKQSHLRPMAQTGLVVSIGAIVAYGVTFAFAGGAATYGVAVPLLLLYVSLLLLKRSRPDGSQESNSM